MQRVGSRAQVMHGNAKMTSGGLTKKHLTYNNAGKIVSKKASKTAKKLNRLVKAGYTTIPGKFGTIKTMRGGYTDEECQGWYNIDQCKINPEFMGFYCREKCSKYKGGTPEDNFYPVGYNILSRGSLYKKDSTVSINFEDIKEQLEISKYNYGRLKLTSQHEESRSIKYHYTQKYIENNESSHNKYILYGPLLSLNFYIPQYNNASKKL